MAPTHFHHLQRREITTTGATAIFIALGCVLVLGAFIYGFLYPYLRKKYFPYSYKPVQTRLNNPGRIRVFPPPQSRSSLTLIPGRFHRTRPRPASTASSITLYNPRLQTPSPQPSTDHESIALHTYSTPRIISPTVNTSGSLFTPIPAENPNYAANGMPRSYTLPRVRSRTGLGRSTTADGDFGDARDYILALPEPLHLRSNTTEKDVAASLNTLPSLRSLPHLEDKHLHTDKLFARLNKADTHNSTCSSTSLKVDTSHDEPPHRMSNEDESTSRASLEKRVEEEPSQEKGKGKEVEQYRGTLASTIPDDIDDASDSGVHNASIQAMHRLQTYRSLIGAAAPEPLTRAGTLTRPKTSVAKMREAYDRSASDSKAGHRTVSRNDTISTFIRTIGNSSDCESVRSSATSPLKTAPEEYTASTSSLLPTPLRIPHDQGVRSASSPQQRRSSIFVEDLEESQPAKHCTPESSHVNVSNKIDMLRDRFNALVNTARPRPPPLSLDANIQPTPHHTTEQPHPPIPPRSFLRPPVDSMQGSSIYSRDTKGLSMARTPITPSFAVAHNLRRPFSPDIPSTMAETESDKGRGSNPIQEDMHEEADVENKVANWDVDMGHLTFNTSPSQSLKQAISSLGADCASNSEVSDQGNNAHRLSAISTDIAPSEARLSSLVGPVRVSGVIETDDDENGSWNSPGDRTWS